MALLVRGILAALTALLVLSGCGRDEPSESVGQTHTASTGEQYNDADVAFATQMIQHHAQALSMVDLTVGRTLDPEVAELADGVRTAQGPEIEQMTDWLRDWDKPIPETVRDHSNAHGDGHADSDGPGMMSADEMERLDDARGEDFEQLWLEMMIEHHEGAIDMARDHRTEGLFPEAVALAEQVVAAQEDEVETMKELLGS
jgi:uncharacterized protein (DUF305 family)